ncbi:MAG: lnt [Acidimicrobiales bacterium]|nr:lnt [Acidimicrobiales bacterium]
MCRDDAVSGRLCHERGPGPGSGAGQQAPDSRRGTGVGQTSRLMSAPTPTGAAEAAPDDSPPVATAPAGRSARAALGAFVLRPMVRAVAIGVLLAASLPPWGFWPLAFVGLALLDRLLADVGWRSRLARGTVVGLALFAPTMVWITQLTAPGYVVAVLVFSVLTGAFCVLVPPSAGRRVALVGAWALCESLRMSWPFGGTPLSLLAVGQVGGPLAGIARIGGVLGMAIATVTIGVALSAAAARQVRPAVIAATAFVALLVLGVVAPHGRDTGRMLDIAFVQGGGEQGTRAINSDSRVVFERHLDASAQVPPGMDLVLWPENVVDTDFDVQDAREGRELQALARRLDAPLLVGTVEGVDDTRFRNSQQVLDRNGEWGDRYVKVQRVPFGEWVPFRSLIERLAPDTLARRDATVSHQSGLLRTDSAPLATVISWEVFFGHRARSGVAAGGQLLYNPTNGSTYTGTFVQTQQMASSRLRAIETGRWEVQVAPTGFSAFVSPDGRVHQRTGTSEQAVEVRRGVPLRTGTTWYVRWGDLPPRVMAVALVAVGWALARLRPRRDDTDTPAMS